MDDKRTQALARNTRRAAELFHAWRQGGIDDIRELIHEADDADDLLDVVCGLLGVGWNLIEAAGHGELDDYLEQLRGATLIAEAIGLEAVNERPACCRCDPSACAADDTGDHCATQACGWCMHGCPAPEGATCCREVSDA